MEKVVDLAVVSRPMIKLLGGVSVALALLLFTIVQSALSKRRRIRREIQTGFAVSLAKAMEGVRKGEDRLVVIKGAFSLDVWAVIAGGEQEASLVSTLIDDGVRVHDASRDDVRDLVNELGGTDAMMLYKTSWFAEPHRVDRTEFGV